MNWKTFVKENNISAAEIYISQLKNALRLEPEFYLSDSKENGLIRGEDVIGYVQYGTSKGLNEGKFGYPVLRLNEFELSFAGHPEKYCDLLSESELKTLKLKKDDVLICRTNGNPKYVGKSALVMEDADYAFASYLFRIQTNSKIKPSVLVSYLNSKAGRKEIEKYAIISNQANFSPAKFKQISIPEIPNKLQEKIDSLFSNSWKLYSSAKIEFTNAENLLLNEINLKNYKGTEQNVSVRSLEESILNSRLDAEYWQVELDEIEKVIMEHKEGFDTLENLFIVSDEKAQIEAIKNYSYVELADVNSVIGTIDNFTELKGKELPSRGRMALQKDNIIISSLEGSLDKIALISEIKNNIIGSTGFFVLQKKHYEPEVALVLLKLKPIQKLLKRQAQGTILPAIPKTSLARVFLPKLKKSIQDEIKKMVFKAHTDRYEAKNILEKTKRAVEIFIEQDEKKAIAYLNK